MNTNIEYIKKNESIEDEDPKEEENLMNEEDPIIEENPIQEEEDPMEENDPIAKNKPMKTDANLSTDDDTLIEKDSNNEEVSISRPVDIEYTIDFLMPNDEKLIDIEHINNKVDDYINNFNSDIMKNYKDEFNKLYRKYSNINYKIKILPKDKNNLTKIVVLKNNKNETLIKEITKPTYVYYMDKLTTLKNTISNEREKILFQYKELLSNKELTINDKTTFEKNKTIFVNLLEEYYSYTLYHKKINKISSLNSKSKLIMQSVKTIYTLDTSKSLLLSDIYNIDNSVINEINIYNTTKLTEYNSIIQQLLGIKIEDIKKDTKLKEQIKLYLDKTVKLNLDNKLKNEKTKQDNYINYIIIKLPILN
jgi:hypothetical protein